MSKTTAPKRINDAFEYAIKVSEKIQNYLDSGDDAALFK